MKLERPHREFQRRVPASEVLGKPEEEVPFRLENFFTQEAWDQIVPILLRQLEGVSEMYEIEDFLMSAWSLSLLDPTKVADLRSSQTAKHKIQTMYLKIAANGDLAVLHELTSAVVWLYPDLSILSEVRLVLDSIHESANRLEVDGQVNEIVLSPQTRDKLTTQTEWIGETVRLGWEISTNHNGNSYIGLKYLAVAALLKSFLSRKDNIQLLEIAQQIQREFSFQPRSISDLTDPINTAFDLQRAALIKVVLAESIEVTDVGFVIHDQQKKLEKNSPLPDRKVL